MRLTYAMALCLLLPGCATPWRSASPPRSYELYAPKVRWVTIHEGKASPGHYAYNHCASLAHFNGRFYAVWNGNPSTHLEGKGGQRLLLSTSEDFVHWTPPVHFVGEGAESPLVEPDGVQWQPNLLNYRGRELWCLWHNHSRADDKGRSGVYLSRLGAEPGARWVNERIAFRYRIDGKPYVPFPTQNPWLCDSGRVLAPLTLYRRVPGKKLRVQHNACLYTDDGGATWRCSNVVSRVDDHWAQWEPCVHEQADGRLRLFMRNFTQATPPCTQWQLTCLGTGAGKGEPVRFEPAPSYSHIETANSRPQVFRLPGGRFCMLQHDVEVDHRGYETRLNLATFFSRTGADDFVAGPPFSRRNVISGYPQGIEHGGKLYIVYTTGPGTGPRSIEGAVIDPAPDPTQRYLWPRAKDVVRMAARPDKGGNVRRLNPSYRPMAPRLFELGGRRLLLFERGASAGVEIEPVDSERGEGVALTFAAKVIAVQELGSLILCSFGDKAPIRIGMPSNRPGKLYAFGRDGWRPAGDLPLGQWHKLTVAFGRDAFSVAIGGAAPRSFQNPVVAPNRRLYLGDGYTVDTVPSNRGSEFLIDLGTLTTQVR